MDLLRIVLAILLPPVAVFLTVGIGLHFWINILLTILGVIQGHDSRSLGYCQEKGKVTGRHRGTEV